MITQSGNFMAEFMTRLQSFQEPKAAGAAQLLKDSSAPTFKDVLSNASKSDQYQELNNSEGKETSDDTGAKFKSYREIDSKPVKASSVKTVAKKEDSSSDESTVKSKGNSTDASKEDTKANAVLNSLAQILGIDPGELSKMLQKLNITPQELADPGKVQQNTDKLVQALGLNSEQADTLKELMKQIDVKVESLMKTSDLSKATVADSSAVKASESEKPAEEPKAILVKELQIVDNRGQAPQMQGMADKIKAKLQELSAKQQQDGEAVNNQVSQAVDQVMEQMDANKANDPKIQVNTASEKLPVKSEEPKTVKDSKKEVSKTDNSKTGNSKSEDSKPLEVSGVRVGTDDDENDSKDIIKVSVTDNAEQKSDKEDSSGFELKSEKPKAQAVEKTVDKSDVKYAEIQANQDIKTNAPNEPVKIQKEAPVQKSDVVRQVVEKAKVVLSPDKSEMVMDLKPDNLGKLALKVVTERGMVVAKFIAENQQVKEIIETNMQLLKDTLQKQGLTVQDCSVSVGQDSQRGQSQGNWSGSREDSKNPNRRVELAGINTSNTFDSSENQASKNPYNWTQSSINLTA